MKVSKPTWLWIRGLYLLSLAYLTFCHNMPAAQNDPQRHIVEAGFKTVADHAHAVYSHHLNQYEQHMKGWQSADDARKAEKKGTPRNKQLRNQASQHRIGAAHHAKDIFKPARINRLIYATVKGTQPVKQPGPPSEAQKRRKPRPPSMRSTGPEYKKGWPEDWLKLHDERRIPHAGWMYRPEELRWLLPPESDYGGPLLRDPPHVRKMKRFNKSAPVKQTPHSPQITRSKSWP